MSAKNRIVKLILKIKNIFFLKHKPKVIFIHIPKNAGSSIERALFNTEGAVSHMTALNRANEDIDLFNKSFKFAIVRNPYDRFVSAYEYLKQGGRNNHDLEWSKQNIQHFQSFNEFVLALKDIEYRKKITSWIHFKEQAGFVCDEKNKVLVDYIGKYETLEKDFSHVCKEIGVSASLTHENKTPKRSDYKQYYTDESKAIVLDIYRRDFEVFGYAI